MTLSLDKSEILKKIDNTSNQSELEDIRLFFLGKKGLITSEMKSLSSLDIEQKKQKGQQLNVLKNFIENELIKKKNYLDTVSVNEKIKKEKIDVTLSPRNYEIGKIHPISQSIYKVIDYNRWKVQEIYIYIYK